MNQPKTYTRSMSRWWLRRPNYKWYLIREATSVLVVAYALFLLLGLSRLADSPEAFAAWLAVLQSPVSMALHLLALVGFAYHAWTWFGLLPQTMPLLRFRGQLIENSTIVKAALAVWAAVSVGVLILAMRVLS